MEAQVEDPVGLKSTVATAKIKVDTLPPHNITISGVASGGEIEAGSTNVKVEATDGEGSTPSSGVKSIAIAIDGHEVGKPIGYCSPGPCTAKGEWTLSGGEFSDGEHKLKVTATDNAGNVATEEISFKVHHGAPISVGPGSIESISGEFSLNATDVSVSAPGSGLALHRSYRSRHLTAGVEGPLGPQWALSVGGQESITKLPSGNATLTTSNGAQTTFTSNGKGGFTVPTGDAGLSLSEVKNEKGELTEYELEDASEGVTIRFTSLTGPTASLWKPTKQEGPVALQTVRYIYQTVEGVTRPTYAIAPEPSALSFSCLSKAEKGEKLEKGCRALEFKYASATSATGESKGEWGEYKGRLKEVMFVAYNPSSKAMADSAVAQYSYDKQGRLRAEWNPQISPALKIVYGYDSEGHVTALTAPGQDSWALTYGTIAGDSNAGRLLKVTQAPASVKLWGGEVPKNTEAPKLSGSMVAGVTLGVSDGVWSNEPVAYGYQWEECNSTGKECAPILGATDENYTLTRSDTGRTFLALVSATNGGGTVITASAVSAEVKMPEVTEYASKEGSPYGIVEGPDKNLWFTDRGTSKIGKITTSGTITEYSLPSGSGPVGIAAGPEKENTLWFVDVYTNKIGKITTSGTITEYSLPSGSSPWGGITQGPDGNVWFTDYQSAKIGKITTSGTITEYALPKESQPSGITEGPGGNLWFTETGTSKIGKITTSGTVTEYSLPSGSRPQDITQGPDGNLWFTDNSSGKIGKITTSGTVTEYGVALEGIFDPEPYGITVGPEKDLWFTDFYTSKIGRITTSGTVTEYPVPKGSEPLGITAGPDGNLWFADYGTNELGKMSPSVAAEGEHYVPGPGLTVEYRVPLRGEGLPTLIGEEVEKWGQTDDPVEGTAIFPLDEPQSWPASDYKRAMIDYLDIKGRLVDTAFPGGAISTTEYNADNDVVRTLNPDNRAAALKEGCESKGKCKSAEVSKLLDSESTYNETGGEPGTELLSTLGPQHTVKLTNGTQVEGRAHTIYTYNQGAPVEGGPYHLVTKMTQGAKIAGKEESEVRTTMTSYSGQENLGWKLRKPTSVTTDPGGLELVSKTIYDPKTGNVLETRSPAARTTEKGTPPPGYVSQFGGSGSGAGQLSAPGGVGIDSSGNVWVVDTGHNRVQEFNSKGEFVREFGGSGSGDGAFSKPEGIAVASSGNVYVADTGNNRVQEFNSKGEFVRVIGSVGEGNGQFHELEGVAVDGEGHVWTVEGGLLGTKPRVQEFSSEGAYISQFGSSGTENGKFKSPKGIVVGSKGTIWVADTGNERVQEFKPTGEFVRVFGSEGTSNGQFEKPVGLGFDPEGDLWVADMDNDRVQRFTAEGSYLSQFGTVGNGNGQFAEPRGLAIDSSGNVWVADTGNNRVQELTSSEFVQKFGGSGSGAGQLSAPGGVGIDSSGNVWVVDTGHNRVQEFNSKGEFVREFGGSGSGDGAFSKPEGIAVASSGNVYVADTGNNRVQEFNSKGEFVRVIGSVGEGNGQFHELEGVAVDGEGHVWTVEGGLLGTKPRVQEFSSEGAYISQFGSSGTENGKFKSPKGIVVGSKGTIWVADTGNERVQEFKPTGEFVRVFGSEGTSNGQFEKPVGLGFDPEGDLWVADMDNDRVQRFTAEGSYLSQFGTVGNGNGQFAEPRGLAIDSSGNVWVADTGNNRVQELTSSEFVQKFGGSGSGAGQLSAPGGVGIDSSGNVWVVDTGHNRVQEFNSKGEFVREFGGSGSGDGAFSKPEGIAVASSGNVYVADTGNNRVQEFNSKGEFVRVIGSVGEGNGQFHELEGVAVDGEGHVWTVEGGLLGTKPRVQEFSSEGAYISQFGSSGTENGKFKSPKGIVVGSKGTIWVADTGNERVQEFKPTGEFVRVFGSEGTSNGQFEKPVGLGFDPEGDLWVADMDNDRVQRFTAEGSYLSQFGTVGNGNGQFAEPRGLAIDSSGNVWVADTGNNRVQELTSSEFVQKFGGSGSGAGQLSAPGGVGIDSSGNVWVVDTGHNRVQEFNSKGEFVREFGGSGSGDGAFSKPEGIAVASSGNVYVADTGNNRVQEFNSKGEFVRVIGSVGEGNGQFHELEGVAVDGEGHVWTVEGGLLGTKPRVQEFSSEGAYISQFGSSGTENGKFKSPKGIVVGSKGTIWVADTGNERVQEFKPTGEFVRVFGSEGTSNGQFEKPVGLGFDPEGDLWVADMDNDRVQRFTAEGSYLSQFGTVGNGNGQFAEPRGLAIDSSGNVWVADTGNNRVQELNSVAVGSGGVHGQQTVYYSAEAKSIYPNCGLHPEWAGLPCRTQPAEQPETSGLPNLPITTYTTYNMWDEPEKTEETVGSTTRTKTATYDAAGRLKTSAISSTVGTALPAVTDEYNSETGALEKQSTTSEGKTKTITSLYNAIGELTSYTDADEATTTYEYDVDGRIKKTNDGKGTETYTYNETTGFLTELLNEYGTTKLSFTAKYDIEGNLLTEGYPNGMNADYTYDQTGKPIGLEYVKTTHCTEKCTWFSDGVVPSIHGQWLEQTSTLGHQAYTYDAAGRLTQVQDTPVGKGCITRIYGYEEDTNRTSFTTREPGFEGKCATEGGTEEKHTYDEADRLTDTGIVYNTFGDITSLPAVDAGGSELTSTYYTDNQLAGETQNGQTIGYNLDPDGRTLETVSTGKKASDVTNHYAGPGSSPAWTANTSGETTRNIPGITGGLTAVQNNSEAPVLQLTNLHGDIIATAYLSETATALASSADTSEFGVPTTNLPPKYSWLGAEEIPTELPSGVLDMGARSYVPQLGRFLQPDPKPGGSANAYTYTFGDPVNTSDPSGEYTMPSSWSIATSAAQASESAAIRAAEIREAEEAAKRAAEEATARMIAEANAMQAYNASHINGYNYELPSGGGEEEWYEEEWYEEEGGYEEAAYHPGSIGEQEAHTEPGLLYQPLGQEGAGEGATLLGSAIPLCKAGAEGPCADFETWMQRVPRGVTRFACSLAAAWSIHCGGDEFTTDMERTGRAADAYEMRPTDEERPGGDDDLWGDIEEGLEAELF